jgi:hypothetical protein
MDLPWLQQPTYAYICIAEEQANGLRTSEVTLEHVNSKVCDSGAFGQECVGNFTKV